MVKELTTVRYCVEEPSVSYTTLVDNNNCKREICTQDLLINPFQMGGPAKIVDIDETNVFSGKKYNQGNLLAHEWIFGGVLRNQKNFHLCRTLHESRHTRRMHPPFYSSRNNDI